MVQSQSHNRAKLMLKWTREVAAGVPVVDDVRVPVEPIQTKELFHIKTNCYQGQLALHNPRPETLKDKRFNFGWNFLFLVD